MAYALSRIANTASAVWLACALLVTAVAGSCDSFGENECETPGNHEKCTCDNGQDSRRTCDAFSLWGECYCDKQACGDDELDAGEECDDGNNEPGDGCAPDCMFENQQQQGPGPGPGVGGFGGVGPVTTMVGPMSSSVGVGGMGGGSAAGGMGGAGGN